MSTMLGTWTALAAMPDSAFGFVSPLAAADGLVYLWDGPLYSYDPGTDTWTPLTGYEPVIDGGMATLGVMSLLPSGGLLYGIAQDLASGLTLSYDPGSDTWDDTLAPPPAPTTAAAVVGDGRIYVVPSFTTSDLHVYDIATDAWSTLTPLPATEQFNSSAVIADGRLWLFGSTDGGDEDELWVYDIAEDSWSRGAAPPWATGGGANLTALSETRVLAGGGNGFGATTEYWVMDVDTQIFESIGDAPVLYTQNAVTLDGVAYVNRISDTSFYSISVEEALHCSSLAFKGSG